MTLYHYTNLNSFLKIWRYKHLLFSTSHKRTNNDIFEKQKYITIAGDALSVNRKHLESFWASIDNYKQISLTMDYRDCQGCLSPMMWGQYADNGNGVCIELDYDKMMHPKDTIWAHRIVYKKLHPQVTIEAETIKERSLHDEFIIKNRDVIFFKKHKHWRNENEFRLVSKDCPYVDISNAIVAIYVNNFNSHTAYVVRKVVADDHKVKYLNAIPIDGDMTLIPVSFK